MDIGLHLTQRGQNKVARTRSHGIARVKVEALNHQRRPRSFPQLPIHENGSPTIETGPKNVWWNSWSPSLTRRKISKKISGKAAKQTDLDMCGAAVANGNKRTFSARQVDRSNSDLI